MTIKTALLIIGGLTLLAGLAVGIILVSQQQLLKNKATCQPSPSNTDCVATFTLTDTALSTVTVGNDLVVSGVVNTNGKAINLYQVRLSYAYSTSAGETISLPDTTVTKTEPAFTTCPINHIQDDTANKVVHIDVSCGTDTNSSWTSNGAQTVFTFRIHGVTPGQVILNFDNVLSKVTLSSDTTDVLQQLDTPTFTYTVAAASAATATPSPIASLTPTSAANPSITPTTVPGSSPTPSPTVVAGQSPTPSPTVGAGGGTQTPTPSPTVTASNPNACGGDCGSNSNCQSGLYCYQGVCRSSQCPSDTTCTCSEATNPTPTPIGAGGQAGGSTNLPRSGASTPTILMLVSGAVLLLVGLATTL